MTTYYMAVLLSSAVATTATVAAEGDPQVSLADLLRLASGGNPIAYGRIWAYSNRCGIEPELAGAAAARVANAAMQTGQASAFEDFFAKVRPGSRQGNSVPKAAIDCVGTRNALLDLAGAGRESAPARNENDPHAMVASRNHCRVKLDDPAVIMMSAYLNEKNGIDGSPPSREVNSRNARLADTFIAPQYLSRYRVVPGTVQLDTKGSRPEKLICVRTRSGTQVAVTVITNRENGWTSVMEYLLVDEKGRVFILPDRPPAAAFATPFKKGNDPTTSIAPMSVIDGYPDTKE